MPTGFLLIFDNVYLKFILIQRFQKFFAYFCERHDGKHEWQPHYRVILFVPKDNLAVLDELESVLKLRWQKFVQKYYAKFVGKEIPESYLPALYEHGLIISRYPEDVKDVE